jgi:hypothetical protein
VQVSFNWKLRSCYTLKVLVPVLETERCDPSGSARCSPRYCRSFWGGRIRGTGMLEVVFFPRATNHGPPVEELVREWQHKKYQPLPSAKLLVLRVEWDHSGSSRLVVGLYRGDFLPDACQDQESRFTSQLHPKAGRKSSYGHLLSDTMT